MSLASADASAAPGATTAGGEDIAYALYDFEGADATQLSFAAGDAIRVLVRLESGWFDGINVRTGAKGWLPSNFIAPAPADAAPGAAAASAPAEPEAHEVAAVDAAADSPAESPVRELPTAESPMQVGCPG
jgi:hypothetical protein